MSWYPLGRPVGSTIYPGMQIVSVIIWKVLNAGGIAMSLNDVCCYVPAWFGVIATYFLGLLAYECTKSVNTAIFAAAIMAIIPAHLMRSIGGGFDNEAVAMTAMMMTFYFYCLSLREGGRLWFVGIFAGFAYGFMAATWGGYVFVINMVGLHAGVLALVRYSSKLHRAYTLFYIVGTFLATRVPVISMTPLKSLEQMMPLLVFFALQLFELVEIYRVKKNIPREEVSETSLETSIPLFPCTYIHFITPSRARPRVESIPNAHLSLSATVDVEP